MVKIYISGPISDLINGGIIKGVEEQFKSTVDFLKAEYPNAEIYNPVPHGMDNTDKPWIWHMTYCINKLVDDKFTHIYMMQGFGSSYGCVIELSVARKTGIQPIFPVVQDTGIIIPMGGK